jgi:hypothetical protein
VPQAQARDRFVVVESRHSPRIDHAGAPQPPATPELTLFNESDDEDEGDSYRTDVTQCEQQEPP